MSNPNNYVYVIEREEDGGYWAYLPDLPGCVTNGDTPQEVEGRLADAVQLYLSYYSDRGLPAPPALARVGSLTAA